MRDESVVEITGNPGLFDLKIKEIFRYRDLIKLFVKRNYTIRYKQTVLGPIWLIIHPACLVAMNTFVFGTVAGLSTDGIPKPLFYLAGNIVWTLFQACVVDISGTFINNAAVFGKVYFPRLVVPISLALTQIGDFLIKLLLLGAAGAVYVILGKYTFDLSWKLLLVPVIMVQLSVLGMGVGIIISSLTTKYRDLQMLVNFGITIWMYLTPVVYSIEAIPERYRGLYLLNPVSAPVLFFKNAIFNTACCDVRYLLISMGSTALIVFVGLVLFNRIEHTFMDTV